MTYDSGWLIKQLKFGDFWNSIGEI